MVYPSRAESEWKSRHLMVIIMVVVFRPGWRIKYRKATIYVYIYIYIYIYINVYISSRMAYQV